MNTQYLHFLLNRHKKSKPESGFTLIELIMVMIMISLFSAISLPTFLNQAGKARETEAKNSLGAVGRAQQAYHFENQIFAPTLNTLSVSSIVNTEYYSYPDADTATSSLLKQRAIALDSNNITRNYAIGVYFNTGFYQIALCEAKGVGEVVEVPNSVTDPCTNDGTRLR